MNEGKTRHADDDTIAYIAKLEAESAALWAKCNTYSVKVKALERELKKARFYLPHDKKPKMNPAKAWPLEKLHP